MANTKLAFLAVTVLLLQASWCAMAQQRVPGTAAVMAFTSFEQGKGGGGPTACDGSYHSDEGWFAALPTQWYAGGSRCLKHIGISTSSSIVDAIVVDECDSQSDCKDNVIATSKAVWDALGLDTDSGEVPVVWVDIPQ